MREQMRKDETYDSDTTGSKTGPREYAGREQAGSDALPLCIPDIGDNTSGICQECIGEEFRQGSQDEQSLDVVSKRPWPRWNTV